MDSMKCWDCLLKHLAGAVSYGKEVMSGHGRGNELDHRIDFLGELVNAEHHAETMDSHLFEIISNIRKTLQSNKVTVTVDLIDELRHLYLIVENLSEKEPVKQSTTVSASSSFTTPLPNKQIYNEPLDIVYDRIDNADFFKFSYESIFKFTQNHGKIYALASSIDMTPYPDVVVVDKSLFDFCKSEELTNDFLFMKQNMAWINNDDCLTEIALYSTLRNENNNLAERELKRTGHSSNFHVYDNIKPQPVNKAKYVEVMESIGETTYPITHYYTLLTDVNTAMNSYDKVVVVNRPVCCSTRSKLRSCKWVVWDTQKNFESLVQHVRK